MADEHGTDQSTAGLSAERIGRNDAIFRNANEGIRAAAGSEEFEQPVPFICECADPACRNIVPMTAAEYGEIRSDPRWFLNAPGHEAAAQGWGQVIARHDRYVVVEKVGPAGEVAEQLDGEPNPATATVEVDGGNDQADEA
jgi:hypothetical protein